MPTIDEDLHNAIEQTRQDGHDAEQRVEIESRNVKTTGKRLQTAVAKAGEYQSAEITRNRSLLEEIDVRAAYYLKIREDMDRIIAENLRQRRIVAATLRGAIAGQAAIDADLTRTAEE